MTDFLRFMNQKIDMLQKLADVQRESEEKAKSIAADYGVGLVPKFGFYEYRGSPAAVLRFKRAMEKAAIRNDRSQ